MKEENPGFGFMSISSHQALFNAFLGVDHGWRSKGHISQNTSLPFFSADKEVSFAYMIKQARYIHVHTHSHTQCSRNSSPFHENLTTWLLSSSLVSKMSCWAGEFVFSFSKSLKVWMTELLDWSWKDKQMDGEVGGWTNWYVEKLMLPWMDGWWMVGQMDTWIHPWMMDG